MTTTNPPNLRPKLSEALSKLAESFPALHDAPGVRPFDPAVFGAWAEATQRAADDEFAAETGKIVKRTTQTLAQAHIGGSAALGVLGEDGFHAYDAAAFVLAIAYMPGFHPGLGPRATSELSQGMREDIDALMVALFTVANMGRDDRAAIAKWVLDPWTPTDVDPWDGRAAAVPQGARPSLLDADDAWLGTVDPSELADGDVEKFERYRAASVLGVAASTRPPAR